MTTDKTFRLYDDELHEAVNLIWNNEGDKAKKLLVQHATLRHCYYAGYDTVKK